jgi:hypothetical protein
MSAQSLVNTQTLAKLLLLSVRRVRQLTAAGILERARDPATGSEVTGRYVLIQAVNAYVVYLRDQGRYADPAETDHQRSRARRMSALADIEQLRLGRIHGELHYAKDVEFCLTQMITAAKQRLLALPSRCCHALQGKTSPGEITRILTDEVQTALRELSEYNPAMFEAANEEYLASIGAAKPEVQTGANGDGASFSPKPDIEL